MSLEIIGSGLEMKHSWLQHFLVNFNLRMIINYYNIGSPFTIIKGSYHIKQKK
jgi:hypothetical protein